MQTQQQIVQWQEKDWMQQILVMLKHQSSEYAIAVTEANCAQVRQTMQRMLNETLAEQADCYQIMSRQGWYPAAPVANRQELHKSIQTHRQDAQATMHAIQAAGLQGALQHIGNSGQTFGVSQQNGTGQQWQQPQQPQPWQTAQNRQADQGSGAWQNAQPWQQTIQGGAQGVDQQSKWQPPQQQAGHYQPWQSDHRYQ
ncbi:MAG: spore coat protein [Bacilli bacterium]